MHTYFAFFQGIVIDAVAAMTILIPLSIPRFTLVIHPSLIINLMPLFLVQLLHNVLLIKCRTLAKRKRKSYIDFRCTKLSISITLLSYLVILPMKKPFIATAIVLMHNIQKLSTLTTLSAPFTGLLYADTEVSRE